MVRGGSCCVVAICAEGVGCGDALAEEVGAVVSGGGLEVAAYKAHSEVFSGTKEREEGGCGGVPSVMARGLALLLLLLLLLGLVGLLL